MTDTEQPWDDVDVGWSDVVMETWAESMDTTVEELTDSLKKDWWLRQQDLETVLAEECGEIVETIDHDTRLDHTVHVHTTFTDFPSELVENSDCDASMDWFINLCRAINLHTEYRITNKRDVDGQLVLTLAPDSDEDITYVH